MTAEAERPAAAAVLTIDLGAVVANWQTIRRRVAPVGCSAVVKADAYGLGAAQIAPALAAAGCTTFFTALLEEGVALRPLLPGAEIVALSGVLPGYEPDHARHDIVPVLNSLADIARWQAFSWTTDRPQPAWIHLDTGMNRLGLGPDETIRLAEEPQRLAGLEIRGWLSHLACADQPDHPLSAAQLGRFHKALAQLPPGRRSLANSSGIWRSRAFHLDQVRPGAALYGLNPTLECANPMRPVVTLKCRILQVRAIDRGTPVGYGAQHSVGRHSRIATLAVGYADGVLRSSSDRGRVFIEGLPAPVVGRVSMDLLTVDVTDLPEALVQPGGWAEVIGAGRSVDAAAADAGTVGYEILTSLSRRYHRVWLAPATGDPWTS